MDPKESKKSLADGKQGLIRVHSFVPSSHRIDMQLGLFHFGQVLWQLGRPLDFVIVPRAVMLPRLVQSLMSQKHFASCFDLFAVAKR